ncbi:MAG: hypothetical protein HOQ28_05085 [Thermoleophilia bacterium]|nr:hypothetical protein [Thermoleophilia bacterium]
MDGNEETVRGSKRIWGAAALALIAAVLLALAGGASAYPPGSPEAQLGTTRTELIALRGSLTTPSARLWLSRSVASLGWSIDADCWASEGQWPDGLSAGRCWQGIRVALHRLAAADASGELAAKAHPQILEIVNMVKGLAETASSMASSFRFLQDPGGFARWWSIQHDIDLGDRHLLLDARWAFNDYLRAWGRWGNTSLDYPPIATAFGAETVQPKVDSNPAGSAEAFQVGATGSALSRINIYVDPGSTATSLVAGIYADGEGGPGQLLAQASTPLAQGGGDWNTVHVPKTALTPGATYWIAILTPDGGGTLRFRDRCCRGGGTSLTAMSLETHLTVLPATWSTGRQFKDGPLTVFGTD